MFCATTRGTVTEFDYPPSPHFRSLFAPYLPFGVLCWVFGSADTGEDGPESEDGQDSNPYPLEGKYVDDADRQKCVFAPLHTRHHD
jgi:hypothetical protein